MGFTSGVTGGVTLTLGLAYLAVHTHQRNREHQAQLLRSQSRVLNSLLEPVVPAPPPSRAQIEAARHDNLVDNAKDRWNAEVAGALRWLQRTDWTDVREGLEAGASRAWRGTFGDPEPQIEEAKQRAAAGAQEVAREAKGAWERARDKAAAAAESRAAEAKRILSAEAAEAKQAAKDAAEAGREEGEGLLQKAKKAVGLAEDKIEEKAGEVKAKAENVLFTGTSSPVERALQQRYEQRTPTKKSVAEVLDERYLPTAMKDHSNLRGI